MRSSLPFLAFFIVINVFSQKENTALFLRDSVELEEVQVTAARYPQSLRNLAAPVQIITQSQLQRIPTGDLSAALVSVPGIQMQSGTFQTLKLTIRGIGSRSQYGTNRTQVYLDDIPLSSGDGTSVFDDLELSFLSRAEITKGSYSAWYGSGMGGAIRFVTRKATDKLFSGDASVTVGSFGLMKFSAIAFSNFKTGKLTAGISRLSGDGFRQNSSFSRNSGLLSGELLNIRALGKINYLVMLSDVHAFTPSSLDELTYFNNPSSAATNWFNAKGFKAYKRLLAGFKIDTKLSDVFTNSFLITTNTYDQYELRPFNILDDRSVVWTAQESLRYTSEKFKAAIGVEALAENYNWQTLANTSEALLTDANETTRHLNAFTSAEMQPLEQLRISLAANVNFTEYQLTENQFPNHPLSNGNYAAKAIFSPMTGIVYQLSKSITFYGSAGHGFSNPTVEESLNSEGKMNSSLQPEQGWTIDVGIKSWFPTSRITLQSSLYTIFLDNLLVTKRPEEDVFYGENAGSSVLKGVELIFKHQPLIWLNYSVSGSISNNRFRDFLDNGISFAGKQLPGIPRSQLFSELKMDLPWKLKFNTAFRYSGVQFADDANEVKVAGWKTLDAGLHYEIRLAKKINLQVQLAVNNLFNEHYASMILINAPSFAGRKPRYYYPAQPRNFVLNVRLQSE